MGNGFFHSGIIDTDESQSVYVYDCGSINRPANRAALTREIGEFGKQLDLRDAGVDIMFISHFDEDHVSGIPELTQRVRVTKFVLPMIPGPDRLLLYSRSLLDRTPGRPIGSFYGSFITDPDAALRALGATGVFFIPPTQPQGGDEGDAGEPLHEERKPIRDIDSDQGNTTAHVDLEISTKLATISRDGDVVWEWRYAQSQQSTSVMKDFAGELVKAGAIAREVDLHDSREIARLVQTRPADLADAYRLAIRKVGRSFTRNLSSLMLYSGPPVAGWCSTLTRRSTACPPFEDVFVSGDRPGFLGLGDANLRSKARRAHVNAVFKERKKRVGTFAPAHHGSHLDWNVSLLDGLGGGSGYRPTLVFSASGAYDHPHLKVLLEANEAGATTKVVGVEEPSRLTESFAIFYQP
ncbi:MBL fold metallo-hydrolase [Sanguibacter keddieii]|uniref:MBL fold metallo-hydrolase n=1 Tax=Sanguibacter keddieii TaxID=60920 RepID=UPI00117EDAF4|nr:MBL fold metallo-hydrolase [Sanguibacter keddieii]